MNVYADYAGHNPLLLQHGFQIFCNKYLVNRKEIVVPLPEGAPAESFPLEDFKEAVLEIAFTIYADYDSVTYAPNSSELGAYTGRLG